MTAISCKYYCEALLPLNLEEWKAKNIYYLDKILLIFSISDICLSFLYWYNCCSANFFLIFTFNLIPDSQLYPYRIYQLQSVKRAAATKQTMKQTVFLKQFACVVQLSSNFYYAPYFFIQPANKRRQSTMLVSLITWKRWERKGGFGNPTTNETPVRCFVSCTQQSSTNFWSSISANDMTFLRAQYDFSDFW